jgi:hypothetical protein
MMKVYHSPIVRARKKEAPRRETGVLADEIFYGKLQRERRCRPRSMDCDVSVLSDDVSVMDCDVRRRATTNRNVGQGTENVGCDDLPRMSMFKNVQRWGRCAAMFNDSEASHFEHHYTGVGLNGHKGPIKKLLKLLVDSNQLMRRSVGLLPSSLSEPRIQPSPRCSGARCGFS